MLLNLSGRSFIKIQYSSFPLFPVAYPFRIATHYNITSSARNDVIFPSGCEARAINIGNKNMKIGIFTGSTSVRSKNIFTDISRFPTGKHENSLHLCSFSDCHIDSLVLCLIDTFLLYPLSMLAASFCILSSCNFWCRFI